MSSGICAAYSLTSVRLTYESTTSSPACWTAVCSARNSRRFSCTAITATSHLWPSIATVTTWQPAVSAAFTAATAASASNIGVGLQNKCSTPTPVDGETGSLFMDSG